jgi:hypothetical protein
MMELPMLAIRTFPTASQRSQASRLLNIGQQALTFVSLLVEVWIETRELQRAMRSRYPFASW